MATTEVKVKQEKLESEENRGTLSAEEAAKQLAAAQTAAALAGAMPVGLTAEQMQALAASAALGQLGSLQYLNGMLTAANTAAAGGSQQGGVTVASTAATPSPLLVVPQIPAQYMAYLPQYAAAAQASTTTQAAQPQATAAVTPATYDAGVLDLSKGPNSKTPSPNTADSANDAEATAKQLAQAAALANIPYEARERTKAEKQDDSQEIGIDGRKGKQTGKDLII